jgi:hypothetical protein
VQQRPEVVKIRGVAGRVLGRLVPAPDRDRRARVRQRLELGGLLGRHRAALDGQRVHRRRGQLPVVAGDDGTQVALGRHVQPDRLGHVLREPLGQPRRARLRVPVVGAGHQLPPADGPLADVPHVVQQRGGHLGLRRARGLGQRRGLPHVHRHAHLFAQVVLGSLAGEQAGDDVDGPHAATSGRSRSAPRPCSRRPPALVNAVRPCRLGPPTARRPPCAHATRQQNWLYKLIHDYTRLRADRVVCQRLLLCVSCGAGRWAAGG